MTASDGVSAGAGGKSVPVDYQVTLAEERTTLARQRNILAVERTFSAWIRTGLALNAVALIMPKLIETGQWLGLERFIGVVLTLTAATMYYMAYRRYHIASRKLEPDVRRYLADRITDMHLATGLNAAKARPETACVFRIDRDQKETPAAVAPSAGVQ